MQKGLLLLALLLLTGAFSASAQDDDNPLLDMLARVPNGIAAREWLTYIDYDAVINARPGAPLVQSWEEFEALSALNGDEIKLYMNALGAIRSGPAFFARYFQQSGEMSEVVGFSLFDIQRGIEYGQPPGQVVILEGDFDSDTIIAAHEARGYMQITEGDFTLLCPAAGCDTGAQSNLADRNLGNPFGGDLGRSQPVLLGNGLVASSTDDQALSTVAAASANEAKTLADQPDYRAAAEAVNSVGAVLQTYFISPLDVSSGSVAALFMNPNMTQEQVEALREQLFERFDPLPQYQLITLAHTVNGNEEQAIVALTYANAGAAQTAAEVIMQRLESYTSLVTRKPFLEMFTDNGVTVDTSIYDPDSNRPTILVTFRSALPPAEVPENAFDTRSIGVPYARLTQAYIQRDLGWLATEF